MDTEKSTNLNLHILYDSISEGQSFLLTTLAKLLGATDAKIIETPAKLHLLPLAANESHGFTAVKQISNNDTFQVSKSEISLTIKQNAHIFVQILLKFESESQAQRASRSSYTASLIPHIKQSLSLSHQLNQQESDIQSIYYVLDNYPIPAIAIDNHFNTIFTNRLAENSLCSAPDDPLLRNALETTNLLSICNPAQKKQFKQCLTQCLQKQCDSKYMNIEINGKSFSVVISPVDSVPNIFRELSRSRVVWVYIITDQYAKTLRKKSNFIELALSAAETELAIQLFEGSSLDKIAHNRRVSKQTVRKQLQSVLRKTQCDTQENLIIFLFEKFIHYGLLT